MSDIGADERKPGLPALRLRKWAGIWHRMETGVEEIERLSGSV